MQVSGNGGSEDERIQEIREKYFKTYLRKNLVTFCEYRVKKTLIFPTVPFVFDYGIN